MSRESRVVSGIRDILESHGLYVINIFGGATTGLDGQPDLVTMDTTGRFVGIEVKPNGEKPTPNQYRRLIDIIESGGRGIVGYDDFNFSDFENSSIERVVITNDDGDEYILAGTNFNRTIEIVIDKETTQND